MGREHKGGIAGEDAVCLETTVELLMVRWWDVDD